jgi:hypothetical protein
MLTMMDIVWTITSIAWFESKSCIFLIPFQHVPYKYNKSKFSWFELVNNTNFKLDVPSLFFLTSQLPLCWHNPSISKKVFFVWFFCTAHREQQEMLELSGSNVSKWLQRISRTCKEDFVQDVFCATVRFLDLVLCSSKKQVFSHKTHQSRENSQD